MKVSYRAGVLSLACIAPLRLPQRAAKIAGIAAA